MSTNNNKQINVEKLALNRFRRASLTPSKAALQMLVERLHEPANAAISRALNELDDDALWKICQEAKAPRATTARPAAKNALASEEAPEETGHRKASSVKGGQ